MWISELTQETVEELCYALEKGLTLDWKALMRKFSTYYSEDDVAMIESREKCHPAKALLDDLTVREMPLEVLVDGLKAIGNNKAVSIIIKGRDYILFCLFVFHLCLRLCISAIPTGILIDYLLFDSEMTWR